MRSHKSIELPDGELAPGFALLNENGETQLVLGATRGGAVITLSDNPNNARVVLYGGAEGGSLAFYDEAGETVWYADSGSSQGVASAPEDKRAGLKQGQEEIATAGPRPPSDDAARPTIRSKCAEEWGDDFKMQKYCQDKQFEALADLRTRTMANGPYAAIRKNCSEQWGTDYKMRDYCEKKQVEALRELNCLTPTIAPHQTLKPLSTQLTEIAIYFIPDEIAAAFHCHLTRSS